jgi:hypothetical protein
MTWFADGASCDYFRRGNASVLRAIGWLEPGREFQKGAIPREVYSKLVALLKNPWQPFLSAGLHECSLCAFHPEAIGTNNLFVPCDAFLYVCPELIVHYINAHAYAPPEAFCGAVLRCPDTRSKEYKHAFLVNGGRELIAKTCHVEPQ